MTRFLEFLTLELKKFKKARGYTNLSVFMFKFMFMLFMFMFKLAVAGSFLFVLFVFVPLSKMIFKMWIKAENGFGWGMYHKHEGVTVIAGVCAVL